MNNQKVKIFSSIENLACYSADFIRKIINDIPEGNYFNIALSGGSTPKAIYQYISNHYGENINWDKVKLFWGDERCVPPDNEQSNYKMVRDALLNGILIPEENIFRILGENDPEEEAKRYSNIIEENVPIVNGFPQFDLILLGLGEDGHTASIFPNHLDHYFSKNNYVITSHPQTKQNRISITGQVINNAKLVVFNVTGKSKAKIVSMIFDKENNQFIPAAFVKPNSGDLIWMLDYEAAQLMNSEVTQSWMVK